MYMADYGNKTSIDHLLNRSEANKFPLLSFKWVCDSLPFGLDPTYVETVDLPWCNIDQQQGWHGAATFSYYPDFSNISSFGITFYEDSNASTMQWIVNWKNRVKTIYVKDNASMGAAQGAEGNASSYGSYNLPKYYKRNMIFTMLATDNSPVMSVELISVWPTDTSNLSLDYSQSDRIKISQTFSCDDQRIRFHKNASSGSFTEDASSLLESSVWSNIGGGAMNFLNTLF